MAAISAFVATYGDARLTIVFRPVKSSRSALSGALVPLYLHPWRWIAIAAPPTAAISDSAATYDDAPRTTVRRAVKSSRSALSGALVPLYLHPWRWIAIAAPPMAAISDSAATYDDVPLTTVFWSVKSSRSALSGALVPLYLHPWRWIAIAAPPTATDSDSAATYGDAL